MALFRSTDFSYWSPCRTMTDVYENHLAHIKQGRQSIILKFSKIHWSQLMSESPERLHWPTFCSIHFSLKKFLHDIAVKSNIYTGAKMQNSTNFWNKGNKGNLQFLEKVRFAKAYLGFFVKNYLLVFFIPKRFILLEKWFWGRSFHLILQQAYACHILKAGTLPPDVCYEWYCDVFSKVLNSGSSGKMIPWLPSQKQCQK